MRLLDKFLDWLYLLTHKNKETYWELDGRYLCVKGNKVYLSREDYIYFGDSLDELRNNGVEFVFTDEEEDRDGKS